MRVPRFYQKTDLELESELELNLRASHHLCVALRARSGEQCSLFNGDGFEYLSEIIHPDKKRTSVVIKSKTSPDTEAKLKIHWAQCISATDRMDYTIQKATELGVNEITPIISERINVKWCADIASKKLGRWLSIATSACEQSYRLKLPRINSLRRFADFIGEQERVRNRFILDTEASLGLAAQEVIDDDIMLVAGPEKGLSRAELDKAKSCGFKRVKFGPRVLRTETVAPAVLAVVQNLWGDI